jgi:hypothetical protein
MLSWLRNLLRRAAPPSFTPNTFIVWEPCTHSHAEVVPGYVKYLVDLGFEVAVFVTPKRYDEGLFSRFNHPAVTPYHLSQRAIRRLFRTQGLDQAQGIMVTTARKISGRSDYAAELALFAQRSSGQRLLLVEHDIKPAADCGALTPGIVTLREPHYGAVTTTTVNPHYFGDVRITAKNSDTTRFITIGAMRSKRRNTQLLIEAVNTLHDAGCTHFIITVIGRGSLRGVPAHLHRYFDIKGRVDFSTLYAEMERADFFLPLLDPDNPSHERYITTGTSGSFQLIYGFRTPCLIAEKFAAVNGFHSDNSVVYARNVDLAKAMRSAISMPHETYSTMQNQLQRDADALYQRSLRSLGTLTGMPDPYGNNS